MNSAFRFLCQGLVMLAFAAFIGYFADSPVYRHFPADQSMIKLSFSHGAERRGECRKLSPEEIAKMPPNMRRPTECPRERLPVLIEMSVDGKTLYQASLPPSGLSGDGPSRAYQRFAMSPGSHRLQIRMRDTARNEGWDFEREADVVLVTSQNFVIDFRTEAGGFIFR